ncbi:MAG: hypothetical protein ACOC3V_00215 [bacterium]
MKTRIIKRNGRFIPQYNNNVILYYLNLGWENFYYYSDNKIFDDLNNKFYNFRDEDDAIKFLETYKNIELCQMEKHMI